MVLMPGIHLSSCSIEYLLLLPVPFIVQLKLPFDQTRGFPILSLASSSHVLQLTWKPHQKDCVVEPDRGFIYCRQKMFSSTSTGYVPAREKRNKGSRAAVTHHRGNNWRCCQANTMKVKVLLQFIKYNESEEKIPFIILWTPPWHFSLFCC